jgi:ribosomal protein S27AE/TM2 domain-containing membrane protein YozV
MVKEIIIFCEILMARFCPKCGAQAISNQSVFCNKCGTRLIEESPKKDENHCPSCGNKTLLKDSVFCNKCGASLSNSQNERTQPFVRQPIKLQEVKAKPTIKTKTCPQCGAAVDEERFYCNSCGAYIRGSASPSSPTIPHKNIDSSERKQQILIVEKSPFLAVLLSFFIVGAGQCYTDQWKKGILLFIFAVISAILCIIVIGIIPLIILWIYSMYDAYHAAIRINQVGGNVDNYRSKPSFGLDHGGRSKSKAGLVAVGVGILFLAVLIAAAVGSSHSGSGSVTTSNNVNSETILTQSLNSMALTINDLPTGWQTANSAKTTSNTYSQSFVYTNFASPQVLTQTLTKYDSINDAENNYNLMKGNITNIKVESVSLGDEGFGDVNVDEATVVFRDSNVIAEVQYVESPYAGTPSVDDASQFAGIIAGRIHS